MFDFLEERGVNSKTVLIVVGLFMLGIGLKCVSLRAFRADIQETRLTINGVVKNDIDSVEPVGRTLFSLAGESCLTLSISIIISIFFIKAIEDNLAEKRSQKLAEIDEQIKQDVFYALFSTLIDKNILETIKTDIFTKKVIRKNVKWTYDFKKLEDGKTHLMETHQYQLHNITNQDHVETIVGYCDNVNGDSVLKEFRCNDGRKDIIIFNRDLLQTSKADSGHQFTPDNKISIHDLADGGTRIEIDIDIPRGQNVHVMQVYETVYEGPLINDSFFTRLPIVDAVLEANYPVGHDFSIFSSLSTQLVPHDVVLNNGASIRKTFSAQGGILPNQGFVFTLKPLPSA